MAKKILYVCQEVAPYVPEGERAIQCRNLLQSMGEYGAQIRTFMPRYGMINERRNQLHEVIRLSGMNLIINDDDHQLILKVASVPSARTQIYFIDNADYFARKEIFSGEDGVPFADNDDRAIFFARGVIETVRRLRWDPDIIHIHGWFGAVVPLYLKHVFSDDPIFRDVKIVLSIYDDAFQTPLNEKFAEKISHEGIKDDNIDILQNPTYENLYKFVLKYADGVMFAAPNVDAQVEEFVKQNCSNIFEYQDPESEGYYKKYSDFYEAL